MLTSITPLGERSRGSRWGTTVVAFLVGSLLAGSALGAATGALGELVGLGSVGVAWRLGLLALALCVGLALDLGVAGARFPTPQRQVNEEWLHAYRGWVYGLLFGAQLGLGVVTVATASAIYLTFCASLLSASALAGAAIGGTFGLVRWATLLPARSVTTPARLVALGARLARVEPAARSAGLAAQGILAALAALAVVLATT
jgi:hypothetical protein